MRIVLALLSTLMIAMFTYLVPAQAAGSMTPSCLMASEGIYQGLWVKHRIYVNEDVVYGANDMNSILTQLENLRNEGLCR
ncbi:MAG: hypothetical protein OM95_01780 [Bdellovibrio sp. ArHS]|uniref:hypothetical protein n=1 Tax=Bdellovibrio sp. ArHS TaxID=1569284 RepID=UPI000583E8A0|nr:hypothetical protein [Bdellovibrio sp. ArHS]KHD89818.1 MAG: hypothetical protein OM95_01780 [Bdellovibrio sp. ArHS]